MIKILNECDEFVVCEKPAGFVSEYSDSPSSLPYALCSQLGLKELYTVHRLDREVGGAIVYAKTQKSAAFLSKQLTDGTFNKEYMAQVQGKLASSTAILSDLLFHDKQKNKTYVVKKKRSGVKEAILEYTIIDYNEKSNLSTLKIKLFTGRTHQIRVQLSSRGFPILGDRKYGSHENIKPIRLHSHKLSFIATNGNELYFVSEPSWE